MTDDETAKIPESVRAIEVLCNRVDALIEKDVVTAEYAEDYLKRLALRLPFGKALDALNIRIEKLVAENTEASIVRIVDETMADLDAIETKNRNDV